MHSRTVAYIAAGAIIAGILVAFILRPASPTLSLLISTEPIPTLLPHAHGIQDKVSDGHHGVEAASLNIEFPETMWVTSFSLETENAPPSIVHHAHVIRVLPDGTRDPFRNLVVTFGQDAVPKIELPSPAGILFEKGDRIAIEAVLHNPVPPLGEGAVYKEVTVNVTVSGFRSGEGRYLPAQFRLARVTDSTDPNDDDSTFQVPPRQDWFTRSTNDNPPGTETASSFRIPRDGWIVFMGAHLHAWEGGKQIDVFIDDRRVRSFSSHLTKADIPWSFQTPASPAFIRVKENQVLFVEASYTNEHDTPIEGAMGMAGIYYVADRFALGSPLYHLSWTFLGWLHEAKEALFAPPAA